MALSLVQFRDAGGVRGVAALEGGGARVIEGAASTLALAQAALAEGRNFAEQIAVAGLGPVLDLGAVILLAPIDCPDPSHLMLSGTGLTHLGSAEGRDKMHRAANAPHSLTDSMKMFLMGVEGGKPPQGQGGVQPEWFYKGDGSALVGPGEALLVPDFALDAGEEPEIAGVYLIDPHGNPTRLGFTLANEFSDHVTERGNYLWLAHSKLRQAALGPELLVGELPADIRGESRIVRDGEVIWEKPFLSGEENMSHTLANLEQHHFKYEQFRRPGSLHVHFFGTATLSFSDGVKTEVGDIFEIRAEPFSLPLRNPIGVAATPNFQVRAL